MARKALKRRKGETAKHYAMRRRLHERTALIVCRHSWAALT